MKKILLLLILSILFVPLKGAEGEFSDKDKTVIFTHSLDLLKEYARLINDIGLYAVSDLEAAQSSSEAFLELFVNRQVLIYNDLDPSHQLSPFYEAESYITNLLLWYHDGIEVEMDFEDAKAGSIVEHENKIYSVDILLSKQINGNYLNRSQNRNREELLFRVAFSRKGAGNYKIVGIRNAASELQIDYSQVMEEVNSEELGENQRAQVAEGVKALMNDYTNFLSLLADPGEPEEDKHFYRESFTGLYSDGQARVFNDLQPEPDDYLMSPGEYLNMLNMSYAGGINNLSLNVDSATIGNVVKKEDGSYYAHAGVTKFFSGAYQGDVVVREMFPLNFRISFEKSGSAFMNYKIESIDLESEDFYQGSGEESNELPQEEITTIGRKGLSISFFGGYGLTMIQNEALGPGAEDYNTNTWESSSGYGLTAGLRLHYYFNDHIALSTGLDFSTYEGSFGLKGEFTDSELSLDINDDLYYKNVYADFDSALSHSYIELPLILNYTSAKPGKLAFFVEAGVSLGYRVQTNYLVTGDNQLFGTYTGHPASADTLYLENLGFFDEKDIYRTGKANISNLNISGYASLGIIIPMGYFSSFKFGPEIFWGFSDINKGVDTRNLFGRVVPHEKTVLKKFGVKLSYILKL